MPTSINTFIRPATLHLGDKIAALSPSLGLPELFPAVYELGLQRLREVFQLEPVEYPTTRKMNAPLEDQVRDFQAAIANPEIKGILCSIGGEGQIKLLKYLDSELIKAHPKPFFGYSDNTNLHLFLWNLGIVSYYGGSIMVHLGRAGMMHPYTVASLKKAFFERGTFEIMPPKEYTDELIDWEDKKILTLPPKMYANTGWKWFNEEQKVDGVTWGGCLEILNLNLQANRYILPNDAYSGKILYLETSEELPSAAYVYDTLMCMGERGLLQQFAAVIVAKPTAWSFEHPNTLAEKAKYVQEQEEAILAALHEYHPETLIVFNLDFGHTDPQMIFPNGSHVTIDGIQKRIFVTY